MGWGRDSERPAEESEYAVESRKQRSDHWHPLKAVHGGWRPAASPVQESRDSQDGEEAV